MFRQWREDVLYLHYSLTTIPFTITSHTWVVYSNGSPSYNTASASLPASERGHRVQILMRSKESEIVKRG
ncbi:MAG: hypothetical protein ABI623_10380 [bacterium]